MASTEELAKDLVTAASVLFRHSTKDVRAHALVILLAKHIAAYVVIGNEEATAAGREQLLNGMIASVRKLLPLYAEDVKQQIASRGTSSSLS
jgi:hypothetical protein